MSSRRDLETRIAERLESLAAEDLQRLGEDYARLRYPDRFQHFDFRALTPDGKSRPGWPDAYIVLPDGSVDGVEATTENTKSGVLRHLAEDLRKARDRVPRLGGFLFVSGQPTIQPSASELSRLRTKFTVEAGLSPDRVDLVFGG